MIRGFATRHAPVLAGAAAVAILTALLLASTPWRETLREHGFDLVLALDQRIRPLPRSHLWAPVIVVDIDDRSLDRVGPWPWPREQIARLIAAIGASDPAAMAVDILFAEPDSRSPAALARRLGVLTQRPELTALANELRDGDKALADAVTGSPAVLGFVLDPEPSAELPPVAFEHTPLALRGQPALGGLWGAAGAVGPVALLAERAKGIGALSLPASGDGVVRQVPLLLAAGGTILPGLALETVRLARGASSYLLEAEPAVLVTANLRIPLAGDGMLRLLPVRPQEHAARTLSAIDVIERRADAARLAGAVVIIGGSAAELGGLRPTATDALTPSVQIEADAIQQLFAGRFPRTLAPAGVTDLAFAGALALIAILLATRFAPFSGALFVIATVFLLWVVTVAVSILVDRVIDPLTPSLIVAAAFVAASINSFAATYRREMLVRRRFEQRLAPAIVRRIVEAPELLKLTGERRDVTSLFTDIEGLTAMTHRADPAELVAILDGYFEGVTAIVVAHGGMIDKIVGDAVHALFNAPLDLKDHAERAVDCAVAIRDWTERYRAEPAPAVLGLGRTRIGIETGPVILGDVGLASRLDYTAYGDAVNAAARLEEANKELGSDICVGPGAAAQCDPAALRPLGSIEVRGRDEALTVYEPWPADAPSEWRQRYLAAFALIDKDCGAAAALFETLAGERPDDRATRLQARRLRAAAVGATI